MNKYDKLIAEAIGLLGKDNATNSLYEETEEMDILNSHNKKIESRPISLLVETSDFLNIDEFKNDIYYISECIKEEINELNRLLLYESAGDVVTYKKRNITFEKIINLIKNLFARFYHWITTVCKKILTFIKTIKGDTIVVNTDLEICAEAITGIPNNVFTTMSKIINFLLNPFTNPKDINDILEYDGLKDLLKPNKKTIKQGFMIKKNSLERTIGYIEAEAEKANKKIKMIDSQKIVNDPKWNKYVNESDSAPTDIFQSSKNIINKYLLYLQEISNSCMLIINNSNEVIDADIKKVKEEK